VIVLKETEISNTTETMNTGAERSKLFPTDIGVVVTDFLTANFDEIMDYNFTALVEKEFDELVMDVRLNNSGKNIIHAQSIRTGSRCPSLIDDKNEDDIIDAIEGEAVYGKVFIPLDGDISTQSSHDGEFPAADTYGNYIYAKVTSFSTFMVDLRDESGNQEYIKLKSQEPLSIESRVVVIHGMSEETDLPATVRTMGPMTIHQSIPIVCGVIQKVLSVPGEIAP